VRFVRLLGYRALASRRLRLFAVLRNDWRIGGSVYLTPHGVDIRSQFGRDWARFHVELKLPRLTFGLDFAYGHKAHPGAAWLVGE